MCADILIPFDEQSLVVRVSLGLKLNSFVELFVFVFIDFAVEGDGCMRSAL